MTQSEQRTLDGGMLVEADGQIRKGRVGALLTVIGLLAALVAGLVVFMGTGDEARVFREVGKRINGTKRGAFDAYFECLFAGRDPQLFHSNAQLSEALVTQAFELGPGWVKLGRDNCLPLLDGAEDDLTVLIAPKEISDNLRVMTQALTDLRAASEGFFAYLERAHGSYDETEVKQRAAAVVRPWYEFRRAHGAVNRIIKQKIAADTGPS